jgi:predicted phage terminase large subunit-like protein
LADETPVLTLTGWKTHGELHVGDYVFSPSGKPVRILAVSEPAEANVRVEFFDGSVFYCHENHEWTMWSMVRKQYETFETRRFLEAKHNRWGLTLGAQKQILSGDRALHHLPLTEPLEFPEQILPVHPYVLGAWLGDGSAGKPCVTHSVHDQAYVDRIASLGYPISSVCVHSKTKVITTYFSGPKPNNAGRLTLGLQALEVYKNKHIPDIYLRGSIAQRLELLAGLIDTDGNVDNNSRCSFTSVNRRLVDNVVDLAHSFGWRTCVTEYQPRLSSSGIQGKQIYWAVAFQPTLNIPVALPRKEIKRFPDRRRIGLKSIQPDPQGKIGRCIQVDSADGLYLVGKTLLPTHNSEMISYLAPAWLLGKFPNKKVIMASHTADLAVNFGRRVRNLVGSDAYREVFSDVELQADSKSASRWGTNHNGEYHAMGVGAAMAGKGADYCIIDDPHSEQEGKLNDPDVFSSVYEWFQSGPLQRLMPGGSIIIVMTRWSKSDLVGQILDHAMRNEEADQWEVVEFPAIMDVLNPETGETEQKSLWPEFWPVEELLAKKASMDNRYWQSQYLQNPVSESGALIKSGWWKTWEAENPPPCVSIIMALDTAQEVNNRADFNALTTWGVFKNEETDKFNIILLNAINQRLEFPELKELVYAEYKEWQPDIFIVEKKNSGAALYQEMQRMGVPVSEFTPSRGNDKISRVNSVTDLFASGIVWAPDRRWAREVIDQAQDFPSGKNDDLVDSLTLALMRFRQGGFLRLPSDEPDPIKYFKSKRKSGYYNPLS